MVNHFRVRHPLHLALLCVAVGGCPVKYPEPNEHASELVAEIISPDSGSEASAGATIAFAGTAKDLRGKYEAYELLVRWTMADGPGLPPIDLCAETNANPSADGDSESGSLGESLCTGVVTAPYVCLTARPPADGGDDPSDEDCITLSLTPTGSPSVVVVEPTPDGVYYSDRLVTMSASVSDPEDAPEALSVLWESNRDGEVASGVTPDSSGNSSSFAYLTQGEHALTATATDTDGHTGTATTIIEVGPPNSAPACAITEPTDGTTASFGVPVGLAGTASDADVPSDWLTATWSSDRDGLLASSTPTTGGDIYASAEDLSLGTHVIGLTVSDEVGTTCTAAVRVTIGGGPEVEILSPWDGTEFYVGDSVEFVGIVSDDQTAPAALDLSWSSDIDGVFATEDADSYGNAVVASSDLSEGVHYITLTAIDGDGLVGTAAVSIEITDCTLPWYRDADGDGFGLDSDVIDSCITPVGYVGIGGDCDDAAPAVNPGAPEACNAEDDDCDGSIDEGVVYSNWYPDSDGDLYGDSAATPTYACVSPSGSVLDASDCDDSNRAVHPGASETCDGLDEDCDGIVDDGFLYVDWYPDLDVDGYGDTDATPTNWCAAASGEVDNGEDCDDLDPDLNPDAVETCDGVDEDCDGVVDDGVTYSDWWPDDDRDGYGDASATSTYDCAAPPGSVSNDGDCDDADVADNPVATETCNGDDDDCDGTADDGLTFRTYYADDDGDGYGSSDTSTYGCSAPVGYVTSSTDCDDDDISVHPGAPETCDGVDEDCDGVVDDGLPYVDWYPDLDADGFGDTDATPTNWCAGASGEIDNGEDCDDVDPDLNPDAVETCDGVDEDCDGVADDGVVYSDWWPDGDRDGYGDASTTATHDCVAPSGSVSNEGDCDDADPADNPGATEVCNGDDDDCDGTADDGLAFRNYYADDDADGYGTSDTSSYACSAPSGYVTSSTDCDDVDLSVHPGAAETCDGVDEDCDGAADDGLSFRYYYLDADGDGYGTSGTSSYACSAPSGYVTTSTDCNDGDASIHPGATETCDGIDQDCDSTADDGLTFRTYYQDADVDGYGTSATSSYTCSAPSGYVTTSTDCNDGSASIHPGATETCDGVDQDCDGTADDGVTFAYYYRDADSDGYGTSATSSYACATPSGYVTTSTDCNDGSSSIHPGATETCDGVDQDCDGTADDGVTFRTYYRDSDSDGYGVSTTSTYACAAPSGYTTYSTDCDDGDSSTHPGASESCDDEDDDCDNVIDDNSSCWVAIYRFIDPVSGAHCWDDDTSAPSTCSGYTYEQEAWIGRTNSASNNWHAVQCSKSSDHIILEKYSSDYYTLISDGYNCSTIDLGYIYDLGGAPSGTTPYGDTCSLYRFSGTTSSGGAEHLFSRHETSTSGYSCEPPARGEVMTEHSCFSSAPSGC